jgi:hypothetical protein
VEKLMQLGFFKVSQNAIENNDYKSYPKYEKILINIFKKYNVVINKKITHDLLKKLFIYFSDNEKMLQIPNNIKKSLSANLTKEIDSITNNLINLEKLNNAIRDCLNSKGNDAIVFINRLSKEYTK